MQGKAVVYGDDINTDLIIAGKYTKTTNINDLVEHVMEDLDPDFRKKCADGVSIVVGGENFGCGSSREQAPLALLKSGIECVVAKSFARIFFRNAVNIGLTLVVCDTSPIEDGDTLQYELGSENLMDVTKELSLPVDKIPPLMVRILENGGVTNTLRKYGNFDNLCN